MIQRTAVLATIFTAGLAIVTASANAATIGQLGVLDDTANGGVNPATGLAWAPGDTYRLVFITSTTRDATSTNIADYNAFVQTVANTAGYGSVTWTAIASTSSIDARDNTSTNPGVDGAGVAIFNFNNDKIADNNADLWDGNLDASIYYTEQGIQLAEMDPVWTGTDRNGTKAVANGGDELGSTPQAQYGRAGRGAGSFAWTWVESYNGPATDEYPLYAISEELTVVPEPASLAMGLVGLTLMAARRRRG
jgi:hypothetical protein